MLINFKLENYKSYKDTVEFTMIPGNYRKRKNHVIFKKNAKVLKFSSIYGGNASGKSNFVDAINRTKYMIMTGKIDFDFKELYFKLDNKMKESPSKFEYEILINDRIFAYGCAINFSENIILNEYLYEIKNGNDNCIFDFDYSNKKFELNLKKIKNKNDKKKLEVYKDEYLTNTNEFFLTYINKKNFDLIESSIKDIKNIHNWFENILTVITPHSKPIDMFGLFETKQNNNFISIIELIKTFDTGITNFKKERISFDEFLANMKNQISPDSIDEIKEISNQVNKLVEEEALEFIVNEKYYKVYKEKNNIIVEITSFIHCNVKSAEFQFLEESDGTKRLLELVNVLYYSQFKNKVFVIDEINRSLHPNLSVDFINKFIKLSLKTESQMIVTTHESSLMDLNLLRQDEIWVVDRLSNGASNLISLSKYSIRSDKVLNKDYLLGRYGGVPSLLKILNDGGELNV